MPTGPSPRKRAEDGADQRRPRPLVNRPDRATPILIGLVAATVVLVASRWAPSDPSLLVSCAYLSVLSIVLSRVTVNLPRGRLNLTAIASQAGGMLLPTPLAAIGGLLSGIASYPPKEGSARVIRWTQWADHMFRWTIGAAVHAVVSPWAGATLADVAVILVGSAGNWLTVGLMFRAVYGEQARRVWARNWSPQVGFAFVAFGSASLLLALVLRNTGPAGYLYALLLVLLTISLRGHVRFADLRSVFSRSVEQISMQSAYVEVLEGGMHDLRNLVMVAAGLAKEHGAQPELQETLAAAVDVARRTLRRQDEEQEYFREIELGEIVNRACALVEPIAEQRKISLNVSPPLPTVTVYGDPILLVEVLTNLLANGINASRSGGSVAVRTTERRNGSRVTLVEDSGGGFGHNESLKSAVYASETIAGHGIGLRWCQNVAAQHLGRVSIESSSRQGSTVAFSLPHPQHAKQRLAAIRRTASTESGSP